MKRQIEHPEEIATIRDLMLDGRGVADADGKAVFVHGSITGEQIRFQRRRRKRKYDEAELLEVLQASPDRVEPPCPSFGVCGGCSLQHLSAAAQLNAKQAALLEAFSRIGGLTPEQLLPPLAGRPFGYRRRARLGAKLVDKKGRVLVGFRERGKPYVADMHSCETLVPKLAELIPLLSELIGSLKLQRQIPQIELSYGDNSFSLVIRVLEEPGSSDIEKLQVFERQIGGQIWLQSGGPKTLRPLGPAANYEDLWYDLPAYSLRLAFGPLDFIQVNQDMNRRMISQAMELLAPGKEDRVLDLFCGIGNFTLPLATRCKMVTGIELDPQMVRKAERNAHANSIANAEFYAADLTQSEIRPEWWQNEYDSVVIDPPRAGAQEILPAIAATSASKLLYVSCHPGSLARDAGILTEQHGFRLVTAGAMDMFPQTSHVEAMALFER